MKSRTLMAVAIAGAFGLSASAFAGSNHEVMTPMSVNETGPVVVMQHERLESHQVAAIDTANVGDLELSDATDWTTSYDLMTEANIPDSGLSTEVSRAPLTFEGWDYYVVDMQPASDGLALGDEYAVADQFALAEEEIDFFIPADYLALMSSDDLGVMWDEDGTVTLSLIPEQYSEGPG